MKNLVDMLNESLVNESTYTWKLWGIVDPKLAKKFQRELSKFDGITDNSDYDNDKYIAPVSDRQGCLIDIVLDGKFSAVEKFADKYFLEFGSPGKSESYDAFMEIVKK